MKCVQLTNKSWLLGVNDDPGILCNIDTKYLYMTATKRLEFNSLDEVVAKFGKLDVEAIQPAKDVVTNIDSFPVKHTDAIVQSETPPLYHRGGNVVFAAGYWGIDYSNGWALAFCPKQVTIDTYKTIGPFRNRLEALNQINSMNHKTNIGRGSL